MGNNSQSATAGINAIVESLCHASDELGLSHRVNACEALPSREILTRLMGELRGVLFPRYFGRSGVTADGMRYHVGALLDRVTVGLEEQLRRGLCFVCRKQGCIEDCRERAAEMTRRFVATLPEIQRLLMTDAQAAYEGDPAATSADETIFCYPGIFAMIHHRIAHELYKIGVPMIARIISEQAHSATGIDIHPGARVGERFFIDHGTGVVIGETSVIGNNVRIYQGVTLGAKSFPLDEHGNPIKNIDRHPIIEDDVVIYAGATILGRVVIGKGSVIGGNVWLTHAVPPGSRVSQKDA